jgi:uncharacterized protein YlxW (UPF0749 family)
MDVPVGIHIGTGPPGAPYLPPFPNYRARLHSPLVLEDALARHPRLRVWVMHAGWPMLDDLLAVLWAHPQVHVDVGAISWILPRKEFHRYLQRIVEAGFEKRVMFGSDQMNWPGVIEPAIQAIESAAFLSEKQKRDIELLRARAAELESALSTGSHSKELINEELQRLKVLLGFTELKGPGITLTLKDSILKPPSTDVADQESFILHDYDLQRVVNELNVAGAEAISINGQRLVSRTGIRCVGPVAHINSVPVAPPFVIQVIGEPEVLKSALLIKGGIIDNWLKPLGFPVDIQTSQEVHVPAYTGAVELLYGVAVPSKTAKEKDAEGGEKR